MARVTRNRILLIDDEAQLRKMLRQALEAQGYDVREASDGEEGLRAVHDQAPDLVILDVMMPGLNGNEVCARLKADPHTRLVPVIMHSSLETLPERLLARESDADDYLIKGSSLLELCARVRSLLRQKHYTDELENASVALQAVASVVERRDHFVGEHCREVAETCVLLGERLGLTAAQLEDLRKGAAFHDIGKIALEDSILQKEGPLDPQERLRMQEHASIGSALLTPMRTLRDVVPLVRSHHERLDGSGYPDGLKGDQIPMIVRILTVADIYHALVSKRSYKPAFEPARALEILREEVAKGWWDSTVVEALADLIGPAKT